jgi:hypothetical protein
MDEFKTNLQLFAEPGETPEKPIEEPEVKPDDPIEEPKEKPEEINKDDYIPKDVAVNWKKENKELKRKLREIEQSKISEENKGRLAKIKELAKSKGYDDDLADLLETFGNELLSAIPKKDMEDEDIIEDYKDYAEDNPEAAEYKKELIETVKKFRKADPDFSIEQAYRLIKPRKSAKEMQLEIEQRAALSRRNEKEPPPAGGTAPKDSFPLDKDDERILKKMQEEHPDGGWTREKYYNLMVKNKTRR